MIEFESRTLAWRFLLAILMHQCSLVIILGFSVFALATNRVPDVLAGVVVAIGAVVGFVVAPALAYLSGATVPRERFGLGLAMYASAFWGAEGIREAASVVDLRPAWLMLRPILAVVCVTLFLVLFVGFAEPKFGT